MLKGRRGVVVVDCVFEAKEDKVVGVHNEIEFLKGDKLKVCAYNVHNDSYLLCSVEEEDFKIYVLESELVALVGD